MKTQYKIVFTISCLLLSIGCAEAKRAAEVDLPSNQPILVSEVEGVTNGSHLYLRLEKRWDTSGSDGYNIVETCEIPPGSPLGTSYNCPISVPELELYYSDLNFKVGTLDIPSCPFVEFHPYYYKRASTKIINDWDLESTVVDCAAKPYSNSCYGGAAPVMLGDRWGHDFFYYFVPAIGNQSDYPLPSSNSVRQLGPNAVNYMVTNDILSPIAGQVTAGNPPRVDAFEKVTGVNTWQDYTLQCKDIWGAVLYEIVLKISDENTQGSVGGPVDHFPDWPY